MVLLTRLSPVFPFVLLNYFLGLTAVRTGSYVLANLIGMLPATFLFVYIGAAARDALAGQMDASAGFYQQNLKVVGLLAAVAVVVVVTRIARKALREAEQEQEGDTARKPHLDAQPPASFEKMMLVDDEHDRRLIENCHPPDGSTPHLPRSIISRHRRGHCRTRQRRRRRGTWRQGRFDRAQSHGRRLSERRLRAVERTDPGGARGA